MANKKQDICKKQFLKIEDFVYVINVISVWTSVHKIIVFFETNASILQNTSIEVDMRKKGE